MILKFKALHTTAKGNVLLEPVEHKEPIAKKTTVMFNGKRAGEVFDTIAQVENPLYLAKMFREIDEGAILGTGVTK